MSDSYSWFKDDCLWAKKSDKQSVFKWLPLSRHLQDTSSVAGLLWEHWLSSGQKKHILESLHYEDEDDGKRFVRFLAAVHDLGKATPAFQKQRGFSNSPDLDALLTERLERAGFTGLSEHNFVQSRETPHALAGQTLLASYGVKDDISSIIGGHHGKPTNDQRFFERQKAYLSNYTQEENPEDPVHKKWAKTQRQIFDWALHTAGYGSAEELPGVKQTAQVLLSGIVIMADWIASNETYFPLLGIDENETDGEKRLGKAWRMWFKTHASEPNAAFDIDSLYRERFGDGFIPRDAQKVFFETIDGCQDPGIFILEAPMGLGKTEAALIGAEQLAAQTGRSGIYFALPTQATSNSMFSRINRWVASIEELTDEKVSIQLVHGKAALNKEFASLPRAANVDIDGYDGSGGNDATVVVNQWFSGRKTSLLDDFVVGTVDQILLAALKQKHLALRHLGLSRKVVIIDEVHAYDAYMSRYLGRALEWLGGYGVPVILLSATLPAAKREELVRSYLKGKGLKKREMEVPKPLLASAYPLVTYSDGKQILQTDKFEEIEDTEIKVCPLQEDDLPTVLDRVMQSGGIAGIIVNTVRRAQCFAEKCAEKHGEDSVFVLHSNFIATERIKKENELLSIVGKCAERPKGKIIVGTQVMEQSLDIDFDMLISDLAPMDLLIQRVGRLHRHKIKRPEGLEKPILYVLGTNADLDFEPGSAAVYGGYLLARTQHFLPETLRIPGDISPLVQKTYAEDGIALENRLEEKYKDMKDFFEDEISKKNERASSFLLGSPLYPGRNATISLIKWLENDAPNQSEEFGNAQVRDTQDTIEVIALKKHGEGYSLMGENRDISRETDDPATAMKIASSTLRLPLAFSKSYCIENTIDTLEKYTLKNLGAWQRQSWLKGALGIIFDEDLNDEDLSFELGNKVLHYNPKYGLTYNKKEAE